ncbi:MAG: AAA family ATPase [Candidatus Promineifilaceae bacterium]|nr:AAA family ATPase [Candidatus Promineifilaceae bacterium]
MYERVKSGQARYLAELRPAVSMFISFSGIDYDDDDRAGQKLDAYIRSVQAVLNHYQGYLMHLTIGDKGSYLQASWGAPVAHEDDTYRALKAAAELIAPPSDLAFIHDIRIGISLGMMRTGATGSASRRDYGVLGTEANVSARLMTRAAAEQILVTERVVRSSLGRFAFNKLPEAMRLKGVAKPLAVYEVQRTAPGTAPALPAAAGPTTLVGRQAERELLIRQVEGVASGQGGTVTIQGEAGIGKSRLVEYLLEKCQFQNVTTLFGAGDAIEQTTLYFAWRPVFAELFGVKAEADDPQGSGAVVMQWLQEAGASPETAQMAPLLTAVLPLDLSDNPATAVLAGRERAEATRDLLVTILQLSAARQPLLIVLEDAHWFDSASWALVQRVAECGAPILLVIATRPVGDPPPAELAAILELEDAHLLTLGPLQAADIVSMIEQRLGVQALPKAVAEFILEKGGGNPFFCEELAYALRDTGFLTIKDRVAELAPGVRQLSQLDFPDTVQGVITSRIDRLSPQQQLTLKVASVIGRIFALRTLSDVYPVSQDVPHLVEQLDALVRLDLTPLQTAEPDLNYYFKHIIIQEVAYGLLLFAQRQTLHHAVAHWYEKSYAHDLSPYYPLLAHHWLEAVGESEHEAEILGKAVDYLYKAGEQALRSNAMLEAIEHLSKGLELVKGMPEGPQQLGLELRFQVTLAIPLTLTRGWAALEVGDAYQRAHEICRMLGERPELFLALVGIFTYYLVRGQFVEADEMADVNLDVAGQSEDVELILEASQDRGAAYFYMGELQASLPHFARVHELYIPEAHHYHVFTYGRDPLAVAMQHESLAMWCLGYPDKSLAHSDDALALTGAWHHPFSRAWVLASRCVTLQLRGEVEKMQEAAAELIPLSAEQGFPNWLAQGMIYLGWTQAFQGQTDEGIAQIHEGLGIWRLTGAQLVTPYFLYLLADAYALSGELEQALAALVEAVEQVERTGERWWEAEIYRLRAQVLLRMNEAEQAEEVLEHALSLARRQEARSHELRTGMSLAELWRDKGDKARAYQLLAPLFEGFEEGMATGDLVKARSLLSSLAGD